MVAHLVSHLGSSLGHMNSPQHFLVTTALWVDAKTTGLKQLSLHERIYSASALLLVLLIALNAVLPSAWPLVWTLGVIAAHGFVAGFVAWLWPALRARWETSVGVVAKTVLHLVALLIALIAARHHVSLAMGLPAQDFDLTVSFMVLLTYLPAWALILAVMLTAIYMVGLPVHVMRMSMSRDLNYRRLWSGLAHLVGALVLAIYAGQVFQVSVQSWVGLRKVLRVVALFADYQPAAIYPGIQPDMRIRLHENGIVSSALLDKDGVELCVWDREKPEQVRCLK